MSTNNNHSDIARDLQILKDASNAEKEAQLVLLEANRCSNAAAIAAAVGQMQAAVKLFEETLTRLYDETERCVVYVEEIGEYRLAGPLPRIAAGRIPE